MIFRRRREPPSTPPPGPGRPLTPREALEKRILEAILQFPDRLDEMETRNEENCRRLAARLADLLEK